MPPLASLGLPVKVGIPIGVAALYDLTWIGGHHLHPAEKTRLIDEAQRRVARDDHEWCFPTEHDERMAAFGLACAAMSGELLAELPDSLWPSFPTAEELVARGELSAFHSEFEGHMAVLVERASASIRSSPYRF